MKWMTERLPASVWPVNCLAGRCWWWFQEMAALRRSCLGMQEERAWVGGENKRQERWWWWEENEKLKCALPWGDLYKWPQIEGMLSGMRIPLTPQQSGIRSVYVPYPVMMRLHWRSRGGGGRRACMVQWRSDYPAWSWGMRAERVFYFVNWSVQMEMSERLEN